MENKNVVYVRDFTSTLSQDSAAGICKAIKHAIDIKAEKVVFEPGRYILKNFTNIETEGIFHDAGSKTANRKDCHIPVANCKNLVLEGAVDENGEPSTVLVGYNDGVIHSFLPAILWCEDCENLTVKNIAFTREPVYCSAGEIISKTDTSITVEVFEGNECYDGMGTHCMNRFDPITGALKGESVTYGPGAGTNWKHIGGRKLFLESEKVAAKVSVGEYLSWHQGAQTDFQTYFGRCNNLKLDNIRVFNSNGFCMIAECCCNITARKVVFKPDGNRLFTCPRDAWKLFKCSGYIEIDGMYVQGVRMDGQNMHSNWLFFKEKISANEAVFYCKYTYSPIIEGSLIEFYDKDEVVKIPVLKSFHEGKGDGGNYYRVVLEKEIPGFVNTETFCAAACWEPERYLCRNSEFVNIAGAGHLVRNDNLTILNCKYRNMMNPGILLGAELPTHAEGGHATNILIKWCEFDNCGFYPRYSTAGCVGINSAGFRGPHNKNIIITDNIFKNSDIGVHVIDAQNVYILNNTFENIKEKIVIDRETTKSIFMDGSYV